MNCEHVHRDPMVFEPKWWCRDCRIRVPMDEISATRWRRQWDQLISGQLRDAKALLEVFK